MNCCTPLTKKDGEEHPLGAEGLQWFDKPQNCMVRGKLTMNKLLHSINERKWVKNTHLEQESFKNEMLRFRSA